MNTPKEFGYWWYDDNRRESTRLGGFPDSITRARPCVNVTTLMTILRHLLRWTVFGVFLLPAWIAVADEEVIEESRVKSEIEQTAAMYLCSDEGILESIETDWRTCVRMIAVFGDACWSKLDKFIGSYEVAADEEGMQRMTDIEEIFTPCVQAGLLMSGVESQPNPNIFVEDEKD